MTTITNGEVNWTDDVSTFDKRTSSKDLFLKLDEGDNEVRILTSPYQYLVHRFKKDPTNTKDFGQKVNCSAINGSCPACDDEEHGGKAKPRWLVGVLSRKTGAYKILDVSYTVLDQIQKLAKNSKWGDPQNYDVNILKNSKAPAVGFYTVQALPKEPLSASDMTVRDNIDFDDLKRRVQAPTPEQVQKRIDNIISSDGSFNFGANEKTASKKVVVKPVVAEVDQSDDEDDQGFPAYGAE